MYGRTYDGKTLNFEPSGGLLHASLVMQDKETDSYWSIMTGTSLSGDYKGTDLVELPVGEKMQWSDWIAAHPGTTILSVDGAVHIERNPYESYFASESGFRDAVAEDDRLSTKTPIYALLLEGTPYAVTQASYLGGGVHRLGETTVFFYRPADAEIYRSSVAFAIDGTIAKKDGVWALGSGATFDPESERFHGEGAGAASRIDGFDTFWFNWSMTHPETVVLD